MNAPRILVTGDAGFIGSHLCERLLASGAEVLCVDNFFTGSRANVRNLPGNPNEFTMRQLAELVVELTGSRSAIEHRPLPVDDPRQRQPDIGLARQTLDWSPTIELREGLQKTVAYFDKVLADAPVA